MADTQSSDVDQIGGLTLESEFEHKPVPIAHRRPLRSVAAVWFGFPMILTCAVFGGVITAFLGFWPAVAAILVGNLVMMLYVGTLSFVAGETGLNFALMASRTFGRWGYTAASGFLATIVVGWFAFQTGLTGATLNASFGWNALLLTAIAGVLYIGITFIGIRALAVVGAIAAPLFVALGLVAIGIIAARHSFGQVLSYQGIAGTQATALTFGGAVTIVIATFADSGTMTADFTRWARNGRQAVVASLTAFPIAESVAMLFGAFIVASGAIAAPATNGGDFLPILATNGIVLQALAVLFVFVNLGSVCTHCLYNGSVGWSHIAGGRMRVLVIVLGMVGVAAALAGVWNHFLDWLNILGVFVPPIGAVLITDQVLVRRSVTAQSAHGIRPTAFIGWAVGALVAGAVHFFAPAYAEAVVGMLAAAATYAVVEILVERRPGIRSEPVPVSKTGTSVPSRSVPAGREADYRDGGRETVLSLRRVTKAFGQLVANDEVDLDVRSGEVHALLGENGAGKSTLMKVAYGFYRADSGAVVVHGTPAQIRTPQDARRLGIGMVFQNFTLIPAFTVAENIALFLPGLPAVLRRDAVVKRIDEVAGRYGLTVDAHQLAGRLSVGEQQKVEILKLLLAGARILIFDEPTSVLPPHEVEALFQIFNRLRADGFAVIFITHKLSEVFACADRITVMRAGAVSGTLSVADASEDDLIRLMFGTGRPGSPERKRALQDDVPALLELRQVATANGHGTGRLRGLDLIVRPGEIVGVAGLPGNGQGPLGDVILGIERCERGQRLLFGKDATNWRVNRTRARGVAFIPDNPILSAVVPTMKLEENMALGATSRYSRRHGFGLDWARVRADLLGALQRLGLRIPPLTARAVTLSGGNLQRFTLARELSREPRLVIAIQPTRGLDLATAAQAHQLLVSYREQGAGVVLISQDLPELFSLSDRLLVLRGGDIVGSVLPQESSAYDVGWLMAGAGGVT